MRWSWTAFGCGVAAGAVIALAFVEPWVADDASPWARRDGSDEKATRALAPGGVESPGETPPVRAADTPSAPHDLPDGSAAPGSNSAASPRGRPPGRPRAGHPAPGAVRHGATSAGAAPGTEHGDLVVTDRALINLATVSFTMPLDDQSVAWNQVTPRGPLEQARIAAEQATQRGERRDPSELVADRDGATALAGVGLAVAAQRSDVLSAIAREKGDGMLRRAALAGLVEIAPDDPATIAAVRAAWDEGTAALRAVVLELLPRLPDAAAHALARDAIRGGERSPAALDPLARALLRVEEPAAAIRTAPDVHVALALGVALRGWQGWADRWIVSPEADAVCDALLPWLRGTDLAAQRAEAAVFFPEAQRWTRVAALVADPLVAPEARSLVAAKAFDIQPDRALYVRSVAAFVSDPNVPQQLLEPVFARIDASALGDAVLRSAVAALAERSPSAWLRESARQALQRAKPGDARGLAILRAVYGDGDTWLDVTATLASLIAGGRLEVRASNDLQGDPLVGTVKTLKVEYVHLGRRFETSVGEGGTLSIP